MVLKRPRVERKKKKPVKSPDLQQTQIKSRYQSSLGAAGPIPYAQLIARA